MRRPEIRSSGEPWGGGAASWSLCSACFLWAWLWFGWVPQSSCAEGLIPMQKRWEWGGTLRRWNRLIQLSWDNDSDDFTPPTHSSFCLPLSCDVSRPLPNASSLTVDFSDSKTVETNFYNYSVCGILLLKQQRQNRKKKKDRYPGSFFLFSAWAEFEINMTILYTSFHQI